LCLCQGNLSAIK